MWLHAEWILETMAGWMEWVLERVAGNVRIHGERMLQKLARVAERAGEMA